MFNWIKTAALMAAITALFGVIGASIGGKNGMIMALGFAVVSNFFAYWFSDKMVLKMYRAREVDASSAPQFYQTVQELAQRAGLPMPRVYLIDEDAPNAFATGRNPQNAAVAATTGPRRDGARAGPREAPRHPHFHHLGHHGRRHLGTGQLRHVLWRS